MESNNKRWWIAGVMLIAASQAGATDGFLSNGYGIRAKARGGVSVAMTDDAMGGANNPATMVWVGSRLDVGADWFRPIRSSQRTGSPLPFSASSDSNNFVIPELGYNRMLSPDLSVGVTVFGNGGMNSDYPGGQINCGGGPANPLCGSGRLGIDMMQLIIAPTLSYKLNAAHSIGVAPLLGYQRFKAEGLDAFKGSSSAPTAMTNNGYDSSTGAGLRIGYYGKLSDVVSVGASYATKMNMSKLDHYRGLFADQGSFDIPESYTLGITLRPTTNTRLGLDYQRINYAKVTAIGNSSKKPALFGSSNGPGFGWNNVDVFRIGLDYDYSQKLTLRGGYSHNNQPVSSNDVTMNLISPGVVQDHLTFGFSYKVTPKSELSMSYVHAFEKSVTGPSNFGGTETIRMKQDALGVAYSVLF